MLNSTEDWIILLFANQLERIAKNVISNEKLVTICSQLTNRVIWRFFLLSIFISSIYTLSLAGNIIVHTPSEGTKKENYFNNII